MRTEGQPVSGRRVAMRRRLPTALLWLAGVGVGGAACTASPSALSPVPASVPAPNEGETGYWTLTMDTPGGEVPFVAVEPGSTIRIPGDVLFETGSSLIRPEPAQRLADLAAQLIDHGGFITVVGHTDNAGSGDENRQLGEDRAVAVRNLLVDLGLPPEQVASVLSAGETCPVADNATAVGRTENRRVEIVLADSWSGCRAP
ncbi:MAG: OmpA family protein [Acidimicrobiales bacterium]